MDKAICDFHHFLFTSEYLGGVWQWSFCRRGVAWNLCLPAPRRRRPYLKVNRWSELDRRELGTPERPLLHAVGTVRSGLREEYLCCGWTNRRDCALNRRLGVGTDQP